MSNPNRRTDQASHDERLRQTKTSEYQAVHRPLVTPVTLCGECQQNNVTYIDLQNGKVGHSVQVLVCDQSSSVALCIQDYNLCPAVRISDTLVNRQMLF